VLLYIHLFSRGSLSLLSPPVMEGRHLLFWESKKDLTSGYQCSIVFPSNQEIKIGNRSFENVSQFKYLGTTVTNQNLLQAEIKRRLNSGNACYHSVQNLLSSCLLSKKKM
jgi:hypothetical protein